MAPRTKRARIVDTPTDDDDPPVVEELQEEKPKPKPQPHETLWHDDGNIVLATDAYLYRVHKSVLAKNSAVFRNMFMLPGDGTEGGAAGLGDGLWDGVPMVKMAGDDDVDVYNFLMALYDRKHYQMYETTTLQILISLIVMSAKYECEDIRAEIVKHLKEHYPSKLEDFQKAKTRELFHEPPENHHFQLLSVANKLYTPSLLPSLYYHCSLHDIHDIFSWSHLITQNDLQRIISGRERMTKFAYEVGTDALLPNTKCSNHACYVKRAELVIKNNNYASFDRPMLPLEMSASGVLSLPDSKAKHAEICESCLRNYRSSLKKLRERFWKNLPAIFFMDKWDAMETELHTEAED
ncbi:hypothetical protein SCHPADRAFT_1002445 [Schizopora paradoxa]|uniref:BTB domain-containing protein n=1 Tax=Schizopora paradoxa TaxID=27342 RepID=A0A0H2R393_9AGAM|nr:hypothetical protein SCHPADRAFT_1002445 [Schizopora paradoxa]